MNMEEIYQRERIIGPSVSDAAGLLGVPDAFGLCMDIAAMHAEALGVGFRALAERDLFWLTVKTQLRFLRRPRMMETALLRTWPEAPGKARGDRSYALYCGGALCVCGKTEWAVLNTKTRHMTPMKEVFPADLRFTQPSACPAPYARIPDDFGGTPAYAQYRVRSTDIDVGMHMNNTAYVRAIFGSLSTAERDALPAGRVDVSFRSPCYEGDLLQFQRRETEAGTDFRLSRDGETVLLARVAALEE